MTNLVIDIGNTLTKVAIFNNRTLTSIKLFDEFTVEVLNTYLTHHNINNTIISSVEKEITDLEEIIQQHSRYIKFTADTPNRIKNNYLTPQTLGLDRYAAVIGAEALFPKVNCLIIDSGSCITYDFVDDQRNYNGGSISPGINMRFKAMHDYTKRLPLIKFDAEFNAGFGNDTRSAMLSGVQNGVVNEAIGFIQVLADQYEHLQILLCGGDANFFDSRLKNSIFAPNVKTEPYLVLTGLNEVIHYND